MDTFPKKFCKNVKCNRNGKVKLNIIWATKKITLLFKNSATDN